MPTPVVATLRDDPSGPVLEGVRPSNPWPTADTEEVSLKQASAGHRSRRRLVVRRPAFPFAEDLRADWNPKLPEFAFAANSVSLLMPYAEPYFVKSVRAVLPKLGGRQPGRRPRTTSTRRPATTPSTTASTR